jgi:hypothetical protein
MESKITLTKHNTKEELYDLFFNGTPLPGIELTYPETSEKKIYHKPFHNVLATNKHIVEANQDFNGEPFLRGKFEYMQVLLPEKRQRSLNCFYRVLQGILNGYRVCTKANKNCLKSLANEIYFCCAPLQHVYRQTQERIESFHKIEAIIDKIIATPFLFEGRKRYEPILWNPDYDLSPYEKSDLTNKDGGKAKLNNNLQILLELYYEGMAQKELIEKATLGERTVKRHWKSVIELYNQKKFLDMQIKPTS